MIKERNAQALDIWLLDCQHSGISDLVTFAQGLEKEGSAFHAALTLPYSNGPVAYLLMTWGTNSCTFGLPKNTR
jgi:transposase